MDVWLINKKFIREIFYGAMYFTLMRGGDRVIGLRLYEGELIILVV